MKNVVFISPNFPTNYWQFCRELKNNGLNVLGIGEAPYNELTPELKASQMLTAADQAMATILSEIHEQKQDLHQCQESYLWKYCGTSLCWWYLHTFLKIGQFTVDCDACIGCGQCSKICPTGNIKMINGRPAFGDSCTTCLGCVHWCPKHAIQMGSVNKMGSKRYVNPNIKIQEMFKQEGK